MQLGLEIVGYRLRKRNRRCEIPYKWRSGNSKLGRGSHFDAHTMVKARLPSPTKNISIFYCNVTSLPIVLCGTNAKPTRWSKLSIERLKTADHRRVPTLVMIEGQTLLIRRVSVRVVHVRSTVRGIKVHVEIIYSIIFVVVVDRVGKCGQLGCSIQCVSLSTGNLILSSKWPWSSTRGGAYFLVSWWHSAIHRKVQINYIFCTLQ